MINLLQGDCREVLKTLPGVSVQCVVTSPPYYGLRDYGTAKWEGGGDGCDHRETDRRNSRDKGAFHGGDDTAQTHPYGDVCQRCGAIRIDSQLGLEPTPDAYVANLVAVFREVRRVLRDDGTVWLNLGDSYSAGGGDTYTGFNERYDGTGLNGKQTETHDHFVKLGDKRLPSKNLLGTPWRVAFALQADGWWLRQDIVWAKPNPMPESVTDRCTKSHEYVFLLTKSARYYYDNEAVKEPSTSQDGKAADFKRNTKEQLIPGQDVVQHRVDRDSTIDTGLRNKRDVWIIATQPYSEAHFATMPEKLVEPCVLAGSKPSDVVLDPFNGAGTVGLVALKLGRSYIGIELNPEYIEMTRCRLEEVQPMLLKSNGGK